MRRNSELDVAKKRISELIRERNNLGEQVLTLRDFLILKDQEIRYIKAHSSGYGKWEKFITWIKGIIIISK